MNASLQEYAIAFRILGICLSIIILFGVIGNILSLFVWMIGKRCKNCPTAIYLRFLGLSDALVLSIPGLEMAIFLVDPSVILRNLNNVFCAIMAIAPYFCRQVSTWILVCLTVEQTIAVCRPLLSIASHRKWRQYGLVIFITVISFVDNLPISLAFSWMESR